MQGGVQVHVAGGGLEWRGLHGGSSGSYYAVGSQVFFALAVTVENCREVESSNNSPQILDEGSDCAHHLKCFHRCLSDTCTSTVPVNTVLGALSLLLLALSCVYWLFRAPLDEARWTRPTSTRRYGSRRINPTRPCTHPASPPTIFSTKIGSHGSEQEEVTKVCHRTHRPRLCRCQPRHKHRRRLCQKCHLQHELREHAAGQVPQRLPLPMHPPPCQILAPQSAHSALLSSATSCGLCARSSTLNGRRAVSRPWNWSRYAGSSTTPLRSSAG